MKVGDLIHHRAARSCIGLIIEVGVYTGNRDTKILWANGDIGMTCSKDWALINPGAVPKTNLMKNNDNRDKQSNS